MFGVDDALAGMCFSVTTSRILFAISAMSALSSFRMNVHLSHPEREVEIKGPKRVKDLLRELNLVVEAHLVIRGDDLVTEDEVLRDSDQVEIRPVISGGSASD